jgi:hypothetical protein
MTGHAISAMSREELAGERDRLRVAVAVAEEKIAEAGYGVTDSLRLELDRLVRRYDAVMDLLWRHQGGRRP